MDDEQHRTASLGERKGFFEKANTQIPDYRKVCEDAGRGFLGPYNNAHHILPATTFKRSIEGIKDADKKDYIKNCQHVTPWNINNKNNLMGLPHVRAFILYAQDDANLKGAEPEYIQRRVKSFTQGKRKVSLVNRESDLAKLRVTKPDGHSVHLPVSWGHTHYNHAVIVDLDEVWDLLAEKREEHKLSYENIASHLVGLENKYYGILVTRGARANLQNWSKRNSSTSKRWYDCFTMNAKASPLG